MKPQKCTVETSLKIHAATDCAVCQELLLSANFEISPALESKLYEYVMQLEQARMATFHAQTCFMQPTQLLRLPPKIGLTLLSALDALQLCGTSERKHGSHAPAMMPSELAPSWSCKRCAGNFSKHMHPATTPFRPAAIKRLFSDALEVCVCV